MCVIANKKNTSNNETICHRNKTALEFMLSSFLLPFQFRVEIFKFFSPIPSQEVKCFLCKFRFDFSIGIFMAKSNKFHLITYLPMSIVCFYSLGSSFRKFVPLPHDTLKNYVLKPYFQYLLAFQCKFHRCFYWLFVYSKLLKLLLNHLKCDGKNFHSECDNAFKLLERTFCLVASSLRSLSKS